MTVRIGGKREVEAAVLDVDGTLYDSSLQVKIFETIRIQLVTQLLIIAGITNPTNDQLKQLEKQYREKGENSGDFAGAFKNMGGSVDKYLEIAEAANSRSKHLDPDPKLRAMLEQLGTGAKLAILTASSEAATNGTCSKLLGNDWRTLFAAVMCFDTPGVRGHKPSHEAFLQVLEMLNCSPEKVVMIGDGKNADILPAAFLGMLTVQVGSGDAPADIHLKNVKGLKWD